MGKLKYGRRYSEEQILRILEELGNGKSVDEVCRMYGVVPSTLYRWRSRFGE